jgi:hypothetical protein
MSNDLERIAAKAPDEKTLPSLRKAFIQKGADFVIVDGWTPELIRRDIQWAHDESLLRFDQETSDRESDEQYTALCYRLTDLGRKVLGSDHATT